MASKSKGIPGPRSERVKSWIYGVLNPWIDQLELQIELAKKGNSTFRWNILELEFIRPIDELLDKTGRTLLSDLERVPAVARGVPNFVAAHRNIAKELEGEARRTFHALLQTPVVAKSGERHPREAEALNGNAGVWMAQHLVNNGKDVRQEDASWPLWSLAEPELRVALRETGWNVELAAAYERFIKATTGLQRNVEDVRNRLVDDFDVPAAFFG